MEWEVEELCKLGKIQPDILEVALKELKVYITSSSKVNYHVDKRSNIQ